MTIMNMFVCDLNCEVVRIRFYIGYTLIYIESHYQEAYLNTTPYYKHTWTLSPGPPCLIFRPIKLGFTTLINPNFQTIPNLIPDNHTSSVTSFLNRT